MRVIVDRKIPYIEGVIERLADEVAYADGADFTSELVRDADALFVRTRTRCDEALLRGSRVRFIATATIGFDHIDTDYCRRAGIAWANAPGCNAGGVEQYVHSVLLRLERDRRPDLRHACLGVVGVGHVGSRVARVARELGMEVLLCDPPRAEAEGADGFSSLDELMARCDIITFHTPLTRHGAHPTLHLADEAFFAALGRNPVVINTSRGEVVDGRALLRALDEGRVADAVLDVWEGEPHIDRKLLRRVFIGTPHIAGYSADGKANATRMALQAYCRFFGTEPDFRIEPPAPASPVVQAPTVADALLRIYDPMADSLRLKADPAAFEQLRNHYDYRREASAYHIIIG